MNSVQVVPRDINNIEKAIHKTGFGLYSKFAIILTGLCSFSESLILTTFFLSIPLMACDLPLSENMMISIGVVYSIGESVGSFVFLSVSDIFGKKPLIPVLCALIFASTLASSFVHSYLFLSFFTLFLGSSLSTNTIVMRVNLAESLSKRRRGVVLTLLDLWWSCGYIVSVVGVWSFTPLAIKFYSKDARFFTWRIMIAISSVLSIIIGCISGLLKPSVRYLLYCKKNRDALSVLKEIYAINTSKNSEDFDINEINLNQQITDYGIYRNMPMRIYMEHACALMKTVYRGLEILVGKQFIFRLLTLSYMKTVTFGGIFITHLWIYKVISQTDGCQLTKTDMISLENFTATGDCNVNLKSAVFRDFLLLIPNIILGQIFAIFLIDRIKRKYLIAVSYIISGSCNLAIGFTNNHLFIKIGLGSIYLISSSFGDSIINVAIIEMFPTALRGTAMGEIQFITKIVLAFIKRYLDLPCNTFMIMAGVFMEVAAVLAFFLPEFKGKPMME
nr:uncharacterized protein LOC111428201 isoform X1 [Onthophagus taurus]